MVEEGEHNFIDLAENTVSMLVKAASGYAVDAIPLSKLKQYIYISFVHSHCIFQVRYLPRWAPGTQFLREAEEWRPRVLEMYHTPFDAVMRLRVSAHWSGANDNSWTQTCVAHFRPLAMQGRHFVERFWTRMIATEQMKKIDFWFRISHHRFMFVSHWQIPILPSISLTHSCFNALLSWK